MTWITRAWAHPAAFQRCLRFLAGVVLAVLLLRPQAAQAAQYKEIIGPLRIIGKRQPMMGPYIRQTVQFPRSGWLQKISVYLLDDRKQPLRDQSALCHATFNLGGANWRKTTSQSPYKLPLNEGFQEFKLPEGYGLPFEARDMSEMFVMLQSSSAVMDREFYFDLTMTVLEQGKDAPPKELLRAHAQILAADIPAKGISGDMDWWVPPGKHAYSTYHAYSFTGRAHILATHVHRYATRVELRDPETGKVLFEGRSVENAERQLLEAPSYVGQEGIPIVRGRRYKWTVEYDNPLREDVAAMATFHLFYDPQE